MNNYDDQTSLNTLLMHHQVTITAVYNCAVAQLNKLNDMEHIFDLKNEDDINMLVTIPELFFEKTEAESIIAYFRSEEKNNGRITASQPNLEKYKVLLLSAFVYNPSFFAMAWNWCAYIQDKVRKEQAKPKLELVKPETNTSRSVGNDTWRPNRKINRVAAASPGNQQFGDATHLEGIGDLYQFVEEVKGLYYFQFALTVTNEQLSRPFELEIEFTTVKDGKLYKVTINDTDESEKELWSVRLEDVDVSQGIELNLVKYRSVKKHG